MEPGKVLLLTTLRDWRVIGNGTGGVLVVIRVQSTRTTRHTILHIQPLKRWFFNNCRRIYSLVRLILNYELIVSNQMCFSLLCIRIYICKRPCHPRHTCSLVTFYISVKESWCSRRHVCVRLCAYALRCANISARLRCHPPARHIIALTSWRSCLNK